MMTRHYPREHLSRPPHPNRTERPPIRNNSIYRLRSLLLFRILLGLLPLKPSSHSWARRMLTTHRHSPSQPPRSSPSQHISPIGLRSIHHLSSPQPNRRKSQPHTSSPIHYYFPRPLFHPTTSLRVPRDLLHNRRRSVWLNILYSHRIPRPTRHYWLNFPYCVLLTPTKIPLHIQTPLRIWGRCLVLTLCRCRMIIPVRVYLLMRILFF